MKGTHVCEQPLAHLRTARSDRRFCAATAEGASAGDARRHDDPIELGLMVERREKGDL